MFTATLFFIALLCMVVLFVHKSVVKKREIERKIEAERKEAQKEKK